MRRVAGKCGGRERRAPGYRLAAVLLAVLGLGCAGGPGAVRPHRDLQVIEQADLESSHFQDAYEAVQSLHANWLEARPTSLLAGATDQVLVYFDNIRLGGIAELRGLRLGPVFYIRHFTAVEATERWGVGHTQGVIYVSTHPSGF